MHVDERTKVADLKSYIDQCGEGFDAEVEEHPDTGRADLLVRYKGQILFNGEFKKPTIIEGRNPRAYDLVEDAFEKSQNIQPITSPFFVTSNFNETIIWDNRDGSVPLMNRDIGSIFLKDETGSKILIKTEEDFNRDAHKKALKDMSVILCREILEFKNSKAIFKPLGQSFIEGLNSHLDTAISAAIKYVPQDILGIWWKEQNYEPVSKFGDVEKERIAKYSLYVLANKIVFYYVLKRSFPGRLSSIEISEDVRDIEEIKDILDRAFNRAVSVSGDFEVVFEKYTADKIPFLHNDLVYPVSLLIKFLIAYDFSTLPQDILGNVYDRLIEPRERHSYGQYYTPIPVVDLINALTIKKADARVLDPACGSGTFLTRAFDLKLKLYNDANNDDEKSKREKILEDLFGVDIAGYPAHLATIALSSKLLFQDPDIFPRIVKSDFLDIKLDEVVPRYRISSNHSKHKSDTLRGMVQSVGFKPIDAVVSNLPYIRQENIKDKKESQNKIQNFLIESGYDPESPNNKSDFHVYFWYSLLPFLKDGSRVGFLTSDSWMNVEYGSDLKKFINKYFKIIAIIDSSVERWFEDALVNTSITILERTSNKKERLDNKIKFYRINKKISLIIPDLNSAINVAHMIEKGASDNDIALTREVRQGDIDFNDILKSKLYPYLRAPEEFFKLVTSDKMIPLNQIIDIQFGIKAGANDFFYVEDVTEKYDRGELNKKFGLKRGEIKNLSIIKDGTGEEHVIEKQYLYPIIKSPKEFNIIGTLIFKKNTKKFVVLIEENDKKNIRPYALKYLEHGETFPLAESYSKRSTCQARRPWWKLSPIIKPEIAFPMYLSSSFIFPKTNILLDHQMYFGNIRNEYKNDTLTIYSFMNSSLSYFYFDMYGRGYGGGTVGLMVYETELLPIPDPTIIQPYYKKISEIMHNLEKRKIGSVFEEIWDSKGNFSLSKVKNDRFELDKIMLKAIGIKNPEKFLKIWYPSLILFIKERLDKASSLKTSKKAQKAPFNKIADEILLKIDIKNFPDDYILDEDIVDKIAIKGGEHIQFGRDLDGHFVSIDGEKKYFENSNIAKYVYYCLLRKKIEISIPANVKDVLFEFEKDLNSWKKKIDDEINEITNEKKYLTQLQNLIYTKLNYKL